jgi:hypothetical protein
MSRYDEVSSQDGMQHVLAFWEACEVSFSLIYTNWKFHVGFPPDKPSVSLTSCSKVMS